MSSSAEALNTDAFENVNPTSAALAERLKDCSLSDLPKLALAAANLAAVDGDVAGGAESLISSANRLSEAKLNKEAVSLFVTLRDYITEEADQIRLNKAIANVHGKLALERDLFRQEIEELGCENPDHRVIILSDSLALPRAGEGHDSSTTEETYPALIQASLSKRSTVNVTALCRRYGTMPDVVAALQSMKADLKGVSVLVHIGLNDCATRIFMERDRLALGFLPPNTQTKVVEFARKHRNQIIAANPDFCYVPLPEFRKQIEQVIKVVRAFGGKSLTFATIVQPPVQFEKKTPHMRWNFSRYNMAIYEAVKESSSHLIDIDRLCWENDTKKTLISDGMHIARQGHELLAEAYVDLWDRLHPAS